MITGAVLSAGLGFSAQADPTVFNFANSNQGWTAGLGSGSGANPFTWSSTAGVANHGAWYINGVGAESIKTLTSPVMTVAASGPITVSISHYFNFEASPEPGNTDAWDGGNLSYKVGNGDWTPVPRTSFDAGGYPTFVIDNGVDGLPINLNAIPPTFEPGWGGASAGHEQPRYITSAASFGSFSAGDTVQIGFRAGWDLSGTATSPNWVIGNILVDGVVPEPGATALATGVALAGFGWARRRFSRRATRA